MWEMYDSDKKPREFDARFAYNKPCGLCKTHFRPGDKFYIIIIPSAFRGSHKRLKENMMVHIDEWNELCIGVSTDEEMAQKVINAKFKANKELTTEESARLEAFKEAARKNNFNIEVSKPYGVKMRQIGSSVYVEYNVYLDKIASDFRGKRGFFDGFYQRQIEANVYNAMHAILADGKHNAYNYKESIQSVVNEVNKTMEEIF